MKSKMTRRLEGKVALVTGAGVGIGRSIALLFGSEGAKIGVNICQSLESGKSTVKEIERSGAEAMLLQADISVAREVEGMVSRLVSGYGKIDILVNNSGIGSQNSPDRVTDILEEDWDRVLNVNLKGVMLASKYVIPYMVEQKHGSILNISSIRGVLGNPNLAAYCSSKGAMVLLTRQMALDYARYNIRVNCICPGFVDTEMFRAYLKKQEDPKKSRKVFSEMTPLNRIGRPSEIACPALFLSSDTASFITGSVLVVDGGYTASGVRVVL
jgi:NAD(P)-dependent dehydrogenase (short-subunit alcohol dehydrogenase family)